MSIAYVEEIPTTPQMGRSIIEHDPQSFDYPARGFLMKPGLARRDKTWRRGRAYDQGSTSSCVGQTVKGVLNTSPLSAEVPYRTRAAYDAYSFYRNGQDYDEWPGEEPDYFGTSANGVCKYLKKTGVISEYRWCFGLDDVIDTLVQHGPVAIGVWWYERMMTTDADGFIKPSGRQIGGHEVELHGVKIDDEYVIGTNSWGLGWGVRGRFNLRWTDLDSLLRDQGDAVTITRLATRA